MLIKKETNFNGTTSENFPDFIVRLCMRLGRLQNRKLLTVNVKPIISSLSKLEEYLEQ